MSEGTIRQAAALSDQQIDRILDEMADSFGKQLRSPILHLPSEEGLDYEEVSFPSLDGVPLEAWFIPAIDSNKIVIAIHPMGLAGRGFPLSLSRGDQSGKLSGNDFEVNLFPDYNILHEAEYGMSGATVGSAGFVKE